MLIHNSTEGKEPFKSKSFFQFFLSIFSCNVANLILLESLSKKLTNHHVNLRLVRNIGKTIYFIKNRIPGEIIFKNDPVKTETASTIRKLFLFSFLRNRANQYVGVRLPVRRIEKMIVPVITPSAFTIKIHQDNKKIRFNILRKNKYSKKSKKFIYDWKEIYKLEKFLGNSDLSIQKLWFNLREEMLVKMLENIYHGFLCYLPAYYSRDFGFVGMVHKTLSLKVNCIQVRDIENLLGHAWNLNLYKLRKLF